MMSIQTKLVLAAFVFLLLAVFGWQSGTDWLMVATALLALILAMISIVVMMWAHFTAHLGPEDPKWRPMP